MTFIISDASIRPIKLKDLNKRAEKSQEAPMEVLSENAPAPVRRIGFQDRFGQVGKMDYLMEEYGLLASNIAEAAKEAIKMKGEN